MDALPLVSINGKISREPGAGLPFPVRSFFVGEGLFETMRVRNGRCEFLSRHVARMSGSAEALGLPMPEAAQVERWVAAFLAEGRLMDGMVRVTLTRKGGSGLDAPDDGEAVVVVTGAQGSAYDLAAREQGVKVCIVKDVVRPMDQTARHKTTSYMPLIMARREAEVRGARFAVLLNGEQGVAEADCANVFVVMQDGSIVTPPVKEGALPGVIRGVLLECVPEAHERAVEKEELLKAHALFLTNSLMTVIPVSQEVDSGARFEVDHPALEKFRNAVRRGVNGR